MKKSNPPYAADAAALDNPPPTAGIDGDAERLAEKIMDEDREVLRALAGSQIATAREVMSRRKRALRDLAE